MLQVAEANLATAAGAKIAMDNIKACAFYEKNGWRLVSIHKDADEPYLFYKKNTVGSSANLHLSSLLLLSIISKQSKLGFI